MILNPLSHLLYWMTEYLRFVRVSQIEFERAASFYGVEEKRKPRMIYSAIPCLEDFPSLIHPYNFILADYHFWGRPEIQEALDTWLSQNFTSDLFYKQGMILSFKSPKEAMWFKLRWEGVDN